LIQEGYEYVTIHTCQTIRESIGDYIEITFLMTNEPFKGSIRKMLEAKDSVYREPYVSLRLLFRVADKMPSCFEAIHPVYPPDVCKTLYLIIIFK